VYIGTIAKLLSICNFLLEYHIDKKEKTCVFFFQLFCNVLRITRISLTVQIQRDLKLQVGITFYGLSLLGFSSFYAWIYCMLQIQVYELLH